MIKKILKTIIIFIITLEARIVLRKYHPKIIGVTGSVGKTSTKDAITAVLEKKFYIRSSQKSFNSEIGIPLTILGCGSGWSSVGSWMKIIAEGLALIFLKNHYPKWLILEVGTDRPGDMKGITQWLKPEIVVVTRFGDTPVHVEFFPSRDALIEEKASLVDALGNKGVLVINRDDKDVLALRERALGAKKITYGFDEGSIVRATNVEIFYKDGAPEGILCKIEYKDKTLPLRLYGTASIAFIYTALAAFSVGISLDVNIIDILDTLSRQPLAPGRSQILKGLNNTTLIDETYNSSPTAVALSLKSLGFIETKGRKIAVLGDMLELGKSSADEHKKIGILAKNVADILVTVGFRSKLSDEEARRRRMTKKNLYHFEDSLSAGEFLKGYIQEGDIILLKGSQGIRMERTVKMIMRDPGESKKLLVRQEKEWEDRSPFKK